MVTKHIDTFVEIRNEVCFFFLFFLNNEVCFLITKKQGERDHFNGELHLTKPCFTKERPLIRNHETRPSFTKSNKNTKQDFKCRA